MNVKSMVLTLVTLGILLIIGVQVFGTVGSSINRSTWTSDMNTSYASVNTNFFSSVSLSTIVLIVIAASAIIAALVFGGKKGG